MCTVGDEAEGGIWRRIMLHGFSGIRRRIHFPVRLSVGSVTGLLRERGGGHRAETGKCGSEVSGIR